MALLSENPARQKGTRGVGGVKCAQSIRTTKMRICCVITQHSQHRQIRPLLHRTVFLLELCVKTEKWSGIGRMHVGSIVTWQIFVPVLSLSPLLLPVENGNIVHIYIDGWWMCKYVCALWSFLLWIIFYVAFFNVFFKSYNVMYLSLIFLMHVYCTFLYAIGLFTLEKLSAFQVYHMNAILYKYLWIYK